MQQNMPGRFLEIPVFLGDYFFMPHPVLIAHHFLFPLSFISPPSLRRHRLFHF